MGNNSSTVTKKIPDRISERRKICEKFKACDKDKLYKELLKSESISMNNKKRSRRSKGRSSRRRSKNNKS